MTQSPTFADVQTAAARIKPYAHRTPVLTCTSLNELVGAELFCKCENFQKVATFIHPYNDARVIAGQGTAALELLTDVSDLDVIMAPVGGGGLLSGTAIVTTALAPSTQVIAAEPEAADDAYRSLQAGKILPALDPRTIADGLRTSLGELTFAV